jgi:signal transduction histidine kinase
VELRYSGQARGERIVAAARLIMAVAFLISLEFGRANGFFHDEGMYIVVGYTLFAVVSFLASRLRVGHPRWKGISHVVDIVFFSINMLVLDGSAAPRYLTFLFPLLAACLLFSWKAGLLTSLTLTSVYIAASFVVLEQGGWPALLSEHFVYRSTGYIVLSALAIWFRAREEKVESEIAALSAWPHEFGDRVPTRELLDRAARSMHASRVILLWEERDEPWLEVAWNFGGEFRWVREAPTRFETVVHEDLADVSFIARDASNEHARVVVHRGRTIEEWSGCPLNEDLRREFNISAVLGLQLTGTTFNGWLLLLDRRDYTPDDLMYGELVARLLVTRLDQYYLLHRAQQFAAGSERLRLSRDLHDGVLQSLTGASLQIEALRSQIFSDPAAASERLDEVQTIISADQRELRSFIRQLRPASPRDVEFSLAERLVQLTERFEKQWGLKVELDLHGFTQIVSQALKQEIYSLVSEAVANAAKHASARKVLVTLENAGHYVKVRVRDDGTGFPFVGRYDLATLNELKRGPVTLKERIAYLGGDLQIDSSTSGSTIDVTIPVDWMGA